MSLEVSKEIVPFNAYHSSDVMTDSFHQAAFSGGGRSFHDSDSPEFLRRSALLLNDLDPREIQGVEVQSAGLENAGTWGFPVKVIQILGDVYVKHEISAEIRKE